MTNDFGFKELYPNNHWINIGRVHRSSGDPFFGAFHGKIDEVSVWHEVLSEQKIYEIMWGENVSSSNLVSYWNFEEGEGNTTSDQTSNTSDAELLAGAQWDVETPRPIDYQNEVGSQVDGKNFFLNNSSQSGIIMKDVDGNCWKLTINTSGILKTRQVLCPE